MDSLIMLLIIIIACPCAGGTLAPPPFVGTDQYCESDTHAYVLL